MSFLISALTSLAFGLGIALVLFGSIFCYNAFFDEKEFKNPLIIMTVSFLFIFFGLSLLFGVLL